MALSDLFETELSKKNAEDIKKVQRKRKFKSIKHNVNKRNHGWILGFRSEMLYTSTLLTVFPVM